MKQKWIVWIREKWPFGLLNDKFEMKDLVKIKELIGKIKKEDIQETS